MTKLRGAVIGAGYFSQFHLDAWNRLEDVEIVAVCDPDQQAAQSAADTYGIPAVFSDVNQLLAESEVDFVDIITRPETHLELVKAAAQRGVSVICQKPLAPEFEESRQIVRVAQEAGIRFMVRMPFRLRWILRYSRFNED